MQLIVWLVLGGLVLSYWLQRQHSKNRILQALSYSASWSNDELFASEYLYLTQTITNTADFSIPLLKVETLLPEGLQFVLIEEGVLSSVHDQYRQSVQGLFTLPPGISITRRWRVIAKKRGIYHASDVSMIAIGNDLFGSAAFSAELKKEEGENEVLTVLPRASERIVDIALSLSYAGIRTIPRGLVPDPMAICGAREYTTRDSMNRIDWKQSARLGKLMVRELEYLQKDSYNLFLNMQSCIIEPNPPAISTPGYIEDGIAACASLLDSATANDAPVCLIANAPPPTPEDSLIPEDEIGGKIFCSDEYRRHDQVMQAYRMLAAMPMEISLPIERVMDDILRRPQFYARGGHLVMVTTYLDERMLSFHRAMREMGYHVVFFVLTSYQNAMEIPPDVDVYFRQSEQKGGVIYAS